MNTRRGSSWRSFSESGWRRTTSAFHTPYSKYCRASAPNEPARPIAHPELGVVPHGSPRLSQPDVELVVLVADEALIEPPDRVAGRSVEHAEVHGVDRAFGAADPVAGTARAQARRRRGGDRFLEPRRRLRGLAAADVDGAGADHRLDRAPDVAGRERRMAVDSNDDLARGGGDRGVQARRRHGRRVGDHRAPVRPGRRAQRRSPRCRRRRARPRGRPPTAVDTPARGSKRPRGRDAAPRCGPATRPTRPATRRVRHRGPRSRRAGQTRRLRTTQTVRTRIWRSSTSDQLTRYWRS